MTTDIRFLIIIGIAVMLLLFTSFLLAFIFSQKRKYQYQQAMQQLRDAQQNQLLEAAIRSEEIERHRIAETLHDEVGAILSSSKMHIENIKSRNLDERDKHLHYKGKELLDDAIQKVRGISHNLHSSILQEFGLNEAIRHFLKQLTQGGIIHATTSLDDKYTTRNAGNDISIYRIVQELINNIIKHANATRIEVNSTYSNRILELCISHDGRGLSQQEFEQLRYKKEGLGLKNIQNRIILSKGSIQFHSSNKDCSVSIHVPDNVSANELTT